MYHETNTLLNLFHSGFFMTFLLIAYLIQTFPLYKMAERAGLNNTWFAFVPILNFILMLHLVDYSGWLVLGMILLSLIPFIGAFIVVIFEVCILVKLARNFGLDILGQILMIFFGIFVEYYIVLSDKPFVGYTRYSNK